MQVADKNGYDFLGFKLKIIEGKENVMCIINLPRVLRMCYNQLATHIKTNETFQNYLFETMTHQLD